MTPKPGDKIIVVDSTLSTYGEEFIITNVNANQDCTWVTKEVAALLGTAWLPRRSYQILEEDGVKIEVGDRVIVTNKSWVCDYCKIFIVIDVREQKDWIRAGYEDGSIETIRPGYDTFRLLKRGSKTSSSCPDCNGTGKILLFTSTVKCGCMTKKG